VKGHKFIFGLRGCLAGAQHYQSKTLDASFRRPAAMRCPLCRGNGTIVGPCEREAVSLLESCVGSLAPVCGGDEVRGCVLVQSRFSRGRGACAVDATVRLSYKRAVVSAGGHGAGATCSQSVWFSCTWRVLRTGVSAAATRAGLLPGCLRCRSRIGARGE
jgi:hypothetical protein